jgi:carboxypeptidase family protein
MIPSTPRDASTGARSLRRALLAALLATSIGPQLGAAQATLRGRVVDSEFGQPLAGAVVRIKRGPTLNADSLGRFEAKELPTGAAEITIQVLGYAPRVFTLYLPAASTTDHVFGLDFTGAELPAVVVQARAERLIPRYAEFEQRRQRKLGAYLRWDDLKAFGSVGDALRTVRGVRIRCDQQTFECFAFMARTPQCQPTWWIDGVEVRSFHENTPIRDIYGIEVYRGAGEIPAEFSGSDAGCGVIVIWTKSRPYREP